MHKLIINTALAKRMITIMFWYLPSSASIPNDFGNRNANKSSKIGAATTNIPVIFLPFLRYAIFSSSLLLNLVSLVFSSGTELEFGYRLRDSTYTGDRAIYHFSMLSLSKIVYDSKFKRLNMWGQYHHTYYINYLERRIETDSDVDTEKPFELYLYFEPDLLAELQGRGIQIEVV